MEKSKIRPLIIAIIALVALLLAILGDLGAGLLEKYFHPRDYEAYVEKYSEEYNIPEYIVYAVIKVESGFDPKASSGKADGLMQIAPDTFKYLTSNEHLGENLPSFKVYDPETNIKYGCYYLHYLFEKFHNWNTVFAAYNRGETKVAEWLKDPEYSDGQGNLTYIPTEETADYVKKVNNEIEYYKNLYYTKQKEIQSETGEQTK